MKRVSNAACFGGEQQVWQHQAETVSCSMKLGVFLPPQIADGPCPVLVFLSGLTCTEQNVITKAGAQRYAAAPDAEIQGRLDDRESSPALDGRRIRENHRGIGWIEESMRDAHAETQHQESDLVEIDHAPDDHGIE